MKEILTAIGTLASLTTLLILWASNKVEPPREVRRDGMTAVVDGDTYRYGWSIVESPLRKSDADYERERLAGKTPQDLLKAGVPYPEGLLKMGVWMRGQAIEFGGTVDFPTNFTLAFSAEPAAPVFTNGVWVMTFK